MTAESDETGSRILKAVEAIAIKPSNARAMVEKYLEQSRRDNPDASKQAHQEAVATMVVQRRCRLAGTSGGATALAGVVPGLGTAVTMLDGGRAYAAVCMKLQVDMCMCLAATFWLGSRHRGRASSLSPHDHQQNRRRI